MTAYSPDPKWRTTWPYIKSFVESQPKFVVEQKPRVSQPFQLDPVLNAFKKQ